VELLPKAVETVMAAVEVPICIDSSNPDALIAALKVHQGKALVNSVSGDEHSMARILPVVKQYGAAVIGMAQNEGGIPADARKRIQIAEKIVARAEALGIPKEDVIIDSLVMAVGADPTAGITALETIKGIKDKLGVNQTIGSSNISFGMPDRGLINSTFLVAAIAAGLTCPIVDAAKARPIILAIDLVLNRDSQARRYLEGYRERLAVV
jgi:5-methyltetrahydrofolate--homocysteine methyltransferase